MNESASHPASGVRALGPDSLAWLHAGDNLQLLMAGTTLILQTGHPVVGAWVDDHSIFRDDPWGRLRRTTEWGMRLLYGGPGRAQQAGRDLRELHRDIKGTDTHGRSYFALDPEAYTWVHMTTYYAMVMTERLFGERPLTGDEQARLYAEWCQQGRVLGIRDQDMPPDLPAFWRYFDVMVTDRLEDTPMARYLLDEASARIRKPPQLSWLPEPVWQAGYSRLGNLGRLVTMATLPPAMRAKMGLAWTPKHARRFRRLQRMVRTSLPVLPRRLRYMPPARQALPRRPAAAPKVRKEPIA